MYSFFDECISALHSIKNGSDYDKFVDAYNNHHRIIILGNGGSNSAASHMAQDFTKRGGKFGMSFSDPSMLTCFMNDYGVDNAFVKYLEFFSDNQSLVILISSSGRSNNIINAVKWCSDNRIDYGVLTAFDPDNPVRTMATDSLFNYYIDTKSYGVAECIHQSFLHGVVECE